MTEASKKPPFDGFLIRKPQKQVTPAAMRRPTGTTQVWSVGK